MARKKKEYVVASPFVSASQFIEADGGKKRFEVGDNVSHLDSKRLADLEKRGLVEVKGSDSDEE